MAQTNARYKECVYNLDSVSATRLDMYMHTVWYSPIYSGYYTGVDVACKILLLSGCLSVSSVLIDKAVGERYQNKMCVLVCHVRQCIKLINTRQIHDEYETLQGSDMSNATWLKRCKVQRCTLTMPFSIKYILGLAM